MKFYADLALDCNICIKNYVNVTLGCDICIKSITILLNVALPMSGVQEIVVVFLYMAYVAQHFYCEVE